MSGEVVVSLGFHRVPTSGAHTIRVLVVENPVVRSGLTAVLSSLDGIAVVGVTSSGVEAVRESVLLRPDVVLMNLHMPGGDVFAAIVSWPVQPQRSGGDS